MKTYEFEFIATQRGYGVVCAENEEQAKEKILNQEYEDIMNTWDMKIEEVTKIKEEVE